ncbi:hypothetical protein DXA13_04650 [Clostridium sp. AM58-1XD]|nr:hypothetical protein [Clostridium sp. AM58-1XD]RGZ00350.1 hypothetical protein DXA13_04650 [Clostridium sp. AM58-1XD]
MDNECRLQEEDLLKRIDGVKRVHKVLVGIGEEWSIGRRPDIMAAYEALGKLLNGKDYFIVTMNTDGKIFESSLDHSRIVAPCGNVHWFQCEKACTKDIWEEGEVQDGVCPHCGAPLISNTIKAEAYIEEGYLPQWTAYTKWLSGTLNRDLTVLELGVGFQLPGVIRWPFEKTVFFNKKAHMYRVHETFYQISEELRDKAEGIRSDSVEFIEKSPTIW